MTFPLSVQKSCMNYKDTLLLPEIKVASWSNPKEQEKLFFSNSHTCHSQNSNFIFLGGPPFANGDLHLGHFLNLTIKDAVIRTESYFGNKVNFLTGWDCHGLPIEHKAKSENPNLDSLKLRELCHSEALSSAEKQKNTLKRTGLFLNKTYYTCNKSYEAKQIELFGQLVQKDLVFQSETPTLWSPGAQSSLAEFEVEYKTRKDPSIIVKFKAKDFDILVWTTTPWTLIGNQAIGFNPNFRYCLYEENGYKFVHKIGLDKPIIKEFSPEELSNIKYANLLERECTLIPADYISSENGTGFVHLCPAHGKEDFQACYKFNLPVENVIDENGCIVSNFNELKGVYALKANDSIVQYLKINNLLYSAELKEHDYPHCWRTKVPLFYRTVKNWCIKLDSKKTVGCLEDVKFKPDYIKNRLVNAIKSRDFWCISRQRAWGLPIPCFYDKNTVVWPNFNKLKDFFEENGSQAWFSHSIEELSNLLGVNFSCTLTKSLETMDVWFDSGSAWHCLDTPQADLYLEGSDQTRGWFQSSLLLSSLANGRSPYRKIVCHGFFVDEKGKKLSKSSNSKSVDELLDLYGADTLRLWVLSKEIGPDATFSPKILDSAAKTVKDLRGILRVLSAYSSQTPGADMEYDEIDKAFYNHFKLVRVSLEESLRTYDFHLVLTGLLNFVSRDLSANYLNCKKDILYCDPEFSARRNACISILQEVNYFLLKLCGVFIPFTVCEFGQIASPSINKLQDESSWVNLLSLKESIGPKLEKFKKENGISKNGQVTLYHPNESLARLLCCNFIKSDMIKFEKTCGFECPRCWNYHFHNGLCERCKNTIAI